MPTSSPPEALSSKECQDNFLLDHTYEDLCVHPRVLGDKVPGDGYRLIPLVRDGKQDLKIWVFLLKAGLQIFIKVRIETL